MIEKVPTKKMTALVIPQIHLTEFRLFLCLGKGKLGEAVFIKFKWQAEFL